MAKTEKTDNKDQKVEKSSKKSVKSSYSKKKKSKKNILNGIKNIKANLGEYEKLIKQKDWISIYEKLEKLKVIRSEFFN